MPKISHSYYLGTHFTLDHGTTPSVGVASPRRRKSNKIKLRKVDILQRHGLRH